MERLAGRPNLVMINLVISNRFEQTIMIDPFLLMLAILLALAVLFVGSILEWLTRLRNGSRGKRPS